MSLRAWQDSLAELVISHGRQPHNGRDLSAAERTWLGTLAKSPGYEMTCAVQRWWRTLAVEESTPLALGLLNSVGRHDLFTEYLDTHFEASLFPLLDGLRFLEFLLDQPTQIPHLASVAAFERGLLRLTRAATLGELPTDEWPRLDPERPVMRHPLAGVVRFTAPPEQVLGAILLGIAPPPADVLEEHWLLLAPRLPNFSRRATDLEARILESPDPRTCDGATPGLWESGALIYQDG